MALKISIVWFCFLVTILIAPGLYGAREATVFYSQTCGDVRSHDGMKYASVTQDALEILDAPSGERVALYSMRSPLLFSWSRDDSNIFAVLQVNASLPVEQRVPTTLLCVYNLASASCQQPIRALQIPGYGGGRLSNLRWIDNKTVVYKEGKSTAYRERTVTCVPAVGRYEVSGKKDLPTALSTCTTGLSVRTLLVQAFCCCRRSPKVLLG
jgi:hypothetical protein